MTGHAIKLLFFSGSTRNGSWNTRLAKLGSEIAEANGLDATLADLADYPMPIYNADIEAAGIPQNVLRFRDLLAEHQGVFIACPEYNSSLAPLLKNALDWVSRIPPESGRSDGGRAIYHSRVFAIGGASPGRFGAMRALIHLRQVLSVGLGALVLPEMVSVAHADRAFEANGHLADKDQMAHFKTVLQRLAHAAHCMTGTYLTP